MKIAVITDDFKTISAHFGRARNYLVFTVENGKIAGQEKRAKAHHGQFAVGPEEHHHHGGEHGPDPAADNRHGLMAEPLADCQVLLARGMGNGAYNALRARGITPILTDIADIQSAVQAYLDGTLVDHPERLH